MLNLADIFEDADGDSLTYTVSVNGAGEVVANENYSFTPSTAGITTLAFKANDGVADSMDTHIVTLTDSIPAPSKSQPVVSGSNVLSGSQGDVGAKKVDIELKYASFGAGLEFTCVIGGVEAKATATQNGALAFDFTADQLNALAEGCYDIMVSSAGNGGNYSVKNTKVGTLTIGAPVPTTWTMPATFRATKGFTYQLAKVQPDGRELPALTFARTNKNASISAQGVLTPKTTGKVTIKATDASGASMRCNVTVVGNSFSRTKPLMLAGGGLFTSTKKLYYKNGNLYAEVFVYNRTGKSMRGATGLTFELRDGESLIYSRAIADWRFKNALKHKGYKVYKLTITDAKLPGVKSKAFDLGRSQIQALVTGTALSGQPLQPMTTTTPGATKPKRADAVFAPEPAQAPDSIAPVVLP